MANQRHEVAFVVGAILGSVAGVAYGLVNAPQAGWRTRADLSGFAEELGDRVAHRLAVVSTEFRQLLGDDVSDPMTPGIAYHPVREPRAGQSPEPGAVLPREGVTLL